MAQGLPSSLDAAYEEAESANYTIPKEVEEQLKKQAEETARRNKASEQPLELSPIPQDLGGGSVGTGKVPYLSAFTQAAQRYNVPINVLIGLAEQESRFKPTALGTQTKWGRAKGLMQYLDSTAAGMGINPYDPAQSIDAAARQLRQRLDKGYSMIDAVREHFAGPDRKQWGTKTHNYGIEVMRRANKYQNIGADSPSAQPTAPQQPQRSANPDPSRYRPLTADEIKRIDQAKKEGKSEIVLQIGMKPIQLGTPKATQPKPAQNQDAGFLSDTGNLLISGATNMAINSRELVSRIPFTGKLIVNTIDKINTYFTGKSSEQILNEAKEKYAGKLSAPTAQARQKLWIVEPGDKLEDGSVAKHWGVGPAWKDPRAYYAGVVESTPEMIASMGGTLALAKGTFKAALAKGATREIAAKKAATTATIAGGLIEGGLGGAQASVEVRNSINKLSDDVLRRSEAVQELMKNGKSLQEARKEVAESASTKAFVLAGVGTGVFGGVGDRAIAKIVTEGTKGRMKSALSGMVAEGLLEEAPQSALQQLGQNYAMQDANPDQRLWQGVANQAAGGAAIGSVMGAGIGAAGHRNQQADTTAPAEQVQPEQAAPPPERKVGAIERAVNDGQALDAAISAELESVTGQDSIEQLINQPNATPTNEGTNTATTEQWLGAPGTEVQVSPKEDPSSVYTVRVEGYQNGEVFARDSDGTPIQFGQDDIVSANPVNVPEVPESADVPAPETPAQQPQVQEQPKAEAPAQPKSVTEGVKIESTEIPTLTDFGVTPAETKVATQADVNLSTFDETTPQAAPDTPKAKPVEVDSPEKTLAKMDEAELRERIKYLANQAKASGGWNKRLMDERRKVEAQINKNKEQKIDDKPYFKWEGMSPAERMAAAEKAGIDTDTARDISSKAWGAIDKSITDQLTAKPAPRSKAVPKTPKVEQPKAKQEKADFADAVPDKKESSQPINEVADFERLIIDAHVNNPPMKARIIQDAVKAGRPRHQVLADVNRILDDYKAGNVPAAAAPQAKSIEGKDLGDGWSEFSKDSGSLGIPRSEMPQIKAEHRGAMVNFMNARDIAHKEETVAASSLKPTQAEFSREKIKKASEREGGDRSILVSKDDHVLDGHHQWMAAREKGEDVKIIRLDAPITDLVDAAHEFPSSTVGDSQAAKPVAKTETPKAKRKQTPKQSKNALNLVIGDKVTIPETTNPQGGVTPAQTFEVTGLNGDDVSLTASNGSRDLQSVKFLKQRYGSSLVVDKADTINTRFSRQVESDLEQLRRTYGYRDTHQAPDSDGGFNATQLSEVYPDLSSRNFAREYGDGRPYDSKTVKIMRQMAKTPDADITVYRAVPSDVDVSTLNYGDWVGITEEYAKEHGESRFDGQYKIIAQKVKGTDLFTDGNSIDEWGYAPKGHALEEAKARLKDNLAKLNASLDQGIYQSRVSMMDILRDTEELRHKPSLAKAFLDSINEKVEPVYKKDSLSDDLKALSDQVKATESKYDLIDNHPDLLNKIFDLAEVSKYRSQLDSPLKRIRTRAETMIEAMQGFSAEQKGRIVSQVLNELREYNPEKTERKINERASAQAVIQQAQEKGEAFDRYINDRLKSMDDDVSSILNSRAENIHTSELTPSSVRSVLVNRFGSSVVNKLEKDGVLSIVPNYDIAGVEGFAHGGKVTLIANGLKPQTIIPAFLHELGGHVGFQGVMKPQAYANLMDHFNKLVAARDPIALEAKRLAERETDTNVQRDEYLPYLVTVAARTQQKRPGVRTLLSRIVAAVKVWAFDRLGVSLSLNAHDVLALAERMVDRVAYQEKYAPNDIRFSYAGERARTADIEALNRAKEMKARDLSEGTIRHATGWFTGLDGKWRFELDDSESKVKNLDEMDGAFLESIFEHPTLFRNYPILQTIQMKELSRNDNLEGYYHPGRRIIAINERHLDNPRYVRQVIMHEIQHAIQDIEYFAEGGQSNEKFAESVKNNLQALKQTKIWEREELLNDKADVYQERDRLRHDLRQLSMFETMRKLREYANMDKPSSQLRHVRNNFGMISHLDYETTSGLIPSTQEQRYALRELGRDWYAVGKRTSKQFNPRLKDVTWRAADLIQEFIEPEMLKQFKNEESLKNLRGRMERRINKLYKEITPTEKRKAEIDQFGKKVDMLMNASPTTIYMALAGEIEARDVEQRLDMTDAQRLATQPYFSQRDYTDRAVVVHGNRLQAMKENVETNQDPDIRFSRADDDLGTVSQAEYDSKLNQWWKEAKQIPSDALTNSMRGWGLGLVPLRPMLKEIAKDIPAAQTYLRVKDKMDALRNEWHAKVDAVAQAWLKYRIKNREENRTLMDIMHESTLAQVDPSKPFESIVTIREKDAFEHGNLTDKKRNEIREKIEKDEVRFKEYERIKVDYNALSPEAKGIYTQVRDTYGDMADAFDKTLLDNMEKAINVRIRKAEREYKREMERIKDEGMEGTERENAVADAERALKNAKTKIAWNRKARLTQLRQQFEIQRLAGPYFPLARFGDLFVTVRDAKTGEIVSFSRFEKAQDQRRFAEEMEKDKNHKVEVGALANATDTRKAVDPNFVADVEDILADLPNAEQIKDEVWQRYLESLPDMSIRKSRIHRKGRAGYISDAVRAFGHHLFHGSHQLARMTYSMDLEDALDQARDEARETKDPTRSALVVNEMERRHQFVMNPTGGQLATWVSSFAFIWHLAGSPKAALMNLFQTPIMGVPILAAYDGQNVNSIVRACNQLTRALIDFTQGKGYAERSSRLTAEERDAMEKGYETGIIEKTQGHELAGVAESGVEYNAVRERVMKVISWGFHHTERLNREVTFLAAYRIARNKGVPHEQAISDAGDLVWKTHFDYSNTSRPRLMHSDTMKILLVFRNFQLNMLFRLFRDVHQVMHGDSKEARREALTQLAGITGMMMLNAGITGTWLFGIAMLMAGLFMDDGEDPEEALKKGMVNILGPNLAGLALYGVPGHVTGTALSESIGMPDLWFRSPDSEKEGEEAMNFWVSQLLGAVPAIAAQMVRGVSYIKKGEEYRGIETMLPKMLKDPMKAYRYATDGAKNMKGDTVAEVRWPDVVKQATGFTPARISEQYKINNLNYNKQQLILKSRKQLMDDYYKATQADDEKAVDEVLSKIEKHNEKNPDQPITAKGLIQSVKNRQKGSENAVGGMRYNNKLRERILEDQAPSIYK